MATHLRVIEWDHPRPTRAPKPNDRGLKQVGRVRRPPRQTKGHPLLSLAKELAKKINKVITTIMIRPLDDPT